MGGKYMNKERALLRKKKDPPIKTELCVCLLERDGVNQYLGKW